MKRTELTPDLSYVLHRLEEKIKRNFNSIQVGQIVKFYAEDKSADVNICFKQKVDGEIKNYPLLLKCPVLGNKITCPIEAGEFCIVLFNDVNIDSWWETGEIQTPRDIERHSLSDGLVICGLNSLNNIIEYDNEAICLNWEQTKIKGNLEVEKDLLNKGNITVEGNSETKGNVEGATFSTGGTKGVSGVFVDTGVSASGKTLTITNGLITNIS